MEQPTIRKRALGLVRLVVSDRRPSAVQTLWAIRIALVLGVILGALALIGYPFGITLWDWLVVLIVPAVLAVGGVWFNRRQQEREQEIAEQRAQDEALQAYIDHMARLLTDRERPLRMTEPGDNVRVVARAQTLTALSRLDAKRKRSALQFLYESGLIGEERSSARESGQGDGQQPVIRLIGVDLRGVDLGGAVLSGTDLRGVDLRGARLNYAILTGTDLSGAKLIGASLSHADLTGRANLSHASLIGADLSGAQLYTADLRGAALSGANLSGANLEHAKLSGATLIGLVDVSYAGRAQSARDQAFLREASQRDADLSGANLSGANLSSAMVTEQQLAACKSLEGTIMPNPSDL